MTIWNNMLMIISILLMIDVLYSLYNFHYTFFLELKKRYSQLKITPLRHKFKLLREINEDIPFSRKLIQSTYLAWVIIMLFSNIFILPILLSLIVVITNLLYKKAYIAPITLLFNLVIFFMSYLFTIVVLVLK